MKILFAKNSYKVILQTIVFGVLLVASLHSANAQIHFRFIDDLPGGLVISVANAVSGDGSTVVGYSVAEKKSLPIFWKSEGSLSPFGEGVDSLTSGSVFDVSFTGSKMVGTYEYNIPLGFVGENSFTYDGNFYPLFPQTYDTSDQYCGMESWATRISGDGSTIVGSKDSAAKTGYRVPFKMAGGPIQMLEMPADFNEGIAMGVSYDGSVIVGNITSHLYYPSPYQVVVWKNGGAPQEMARGLAGYVLTVTNLSQDGTTAIGYDGDGNEAKFWHTDFSSGGRLPGICGTPYDVSADGSMIVGETKFIDTLYGTAAYVWDNRRGALLVQDILQKDFGVNLPGWQLRNATGISADGSVIVGNATGPSGWEEGWWAYIPYIILYGPYSNQELIGGNKDTLKWKCAGPQHVNIYLSLDSGKTTQPLAENLITDSSKFIWTIPDTISQNCQIVIKGVEDAAVKAESPIFTIGGYRLKRQKPYSDQWELFDLASHGWSYANSDNPMWPIVWWSQFNYQAGTDPYTNSPYPDREPFFSALPKVFPDWPLFVHTFEQPNCYYGNTGIYRGAAESYWEVIKDKWGGSCFGLALSELFAFDDPSRLQYQFPEMPPYNAPNNQYLPSNFVCTDSIRLVINSLFLYQMGKEHQSYFRTKYETTPKQTLDELRAMFLANARQDKVLILAPDNDPRRHAIMPYRIANNGNAFNIYVHDSNLPGDKETHVFVDTVNNDWVYTNLTNAHGLGWYGRTGLFLTDAINWYYSNPLLPKQSEQKMGKSIFLADDSTYDLYVPRNASITITDDIGRTTGCSGDSIIRQIPKSYPIVPADIASKPLGYTVPKGNYRVNIQKQPDSTSVFKVFTDSMIYSYRRHSVDSLQNDDLDVSRGGFGVRNHDTSPKQFDLDVVLPIGMSTYYLGECRLSMQNLTLEQGDSLSLSILDPAYDIDPIVRNFGSHPTTYDVKFLSYWKGRYTDFNTEKYEHHSIVLEANSSQTLYPKWRDLNGHSVQIDIDNGNDGTVDSTIDLSDQTTDVKDHNSDEKPSGYALLQNYPNPFNPITTIIYQLPNQSHVILKVFDLLGREVATLVNGVEAAGYKSVTFNANGLSSGMYYYRLQVGKYIETKKLLLLR